jgi:hypothetical protein
MAGRVQADGSPADGQALTVAQGLQLDAAQAGAQHALTRCTAQVGAVAAPGMVGMGVGDDSARHRPPGVDMEVARRAIQALRAQHDQVGAVGDGHVSGGGGRHW